MRERRSEMRIMCADMVEVRWRSPGSARFRRVTALLEDISTSGACLQMETAIPLGAEIRCQFAKQEFSGRARYCVYRQIGYFVGVQFEAGSRWSRSAYQPRHLLDLERLVAEARKQGRQRGDPGRPPG
jgi:hypothetical protein